MLILLKLRIVFYLYLGMICKYMLPLPRHPKDSSSI